jgi:hypothetical protein
MKCVHVDGIGEIGVFPLRCSKCKEFQSEGYYVDAESDKEQKELDWYGVDVIFLCDDCIIILSHNYTMRIFGGSGRYLGKWINGRWIE